MEAVVDFLILLSDWLNQRVFRLQMSELASIQVDSVAHPLYTLQNGEEWTLSGATSPVDVLAFGEISSRFVIASYWQTIDDPQAAQVDQLHGFKWC